MKYIAIILILFFSISSCKVKDENKVIENSEKEIDVVKTDSIGDFSVKTLQDSGLTIAVESYKVSANIIRKFNALEIPIKVCASYKIIRDDPQLNSSSNTLLLLTFMNS